MRKALGMLLALGLGLPSVAQEPDPALKRLEQSRRHQEWVVVKNGERSVHAFVVYPEVKDKAPVVIVIHENRGLTDWVRGVADQLAIANAAVVLAAHQRRPVSLAHGLLQSRRDIANRQTDAPVVGTIGFRSMEQQYMMQRGLARFEFDKNGTTTPGSVAVPISVTDSADDIIQAIDQAIANARDAAMRPLNVARHIHQNRINLERAVSASKSLGGALLITGDTPGSVGVISASIPESTGPPSPTSRSSRERRSPGTPARRRTRRCTPQTPA